MPSGDLVVRIDVDVSRFRAALEEAAQNVARVMGTTDAYALQALAAVVRADRWRSYRARSRALYGRRRRKP